MCFSREKPFSFYKKCATYVFGEKNNVPRRICAVGRVMLNRLKSLSATIAFLVCILCSLWISNEISQQDCGTIGRLTEAEVLYGITMNGILFHVAILSSPFIKTFIYFNYGLSKLFNHLDLTRI